jgi:hypothetical protein
MGIVALTVWMGSPLIGQGNSSTSTGWLLNQATLIGLGDIPSHLAMSLEHSGARMMSAAKAQMTINGTVTDGKGSRSAQIVIQAPGYMSYREGQGRAVVFNGNAFQATSGAPSAGDDPVMESLLAHFPDAVCLQAATGGSYRRLGTHFRPDGSKGGSYTGPYWTILAFSPRTRQGLPRGKALQQDLFVAIDEQTGLISEIRVVSKTGSQQQVIQTQFTAWTQQGDQWFPGKITRLENGKQTLSFQLQQASVGTAVPTTVFIP